MRISTILTTVLVAAGLLCGQEAPEQVKPSAQDTEPQNMEAAILTVKTLTGDSFNRLVNLLSVFNLRMRGDDQLRTILVYGPPEAIAQVKAVVAELDRPGSQAAIGRNIEMTMSFLRCPMTPDGVKKLPADLESAARQLQNATQCQNVELWNTVVLRLQEGKDTQQSLRLPDAGSADSGVAATAQIRMRPTAVGTKDQGRYVRFDRADVGFHIPIPTGEPRPGQQNYQYIDVGIQTAGDFYESQKTVIGKVAGQTDIFVVIALKILD